jgi:hypothetical protein
MARAEPRKLPSSNLPMCQPTKFGHNKVRVHKLAPICTNTLETLSRAPVTEKFYNAPISSGDDFLFEIEDADGGQDQNRATPSPLDRHFQSKLDSLLVGTDLLLKAVSRRNVCSTHAGILLVHAELTLVLWSPTPVLRRSAATRHMLSSTLEAASTAWRTSSPALATMCPRSRRKPGETSSPCFASCATIFSFSAQQGTVSRVMMVQGVAASW